jgi:hypothetical protein
MLGLHLMPMEGTLTETQPGMKVHIEEIHLNTVWYDGRTAGAEKPMIRSTYEYTMVTTEIRMLVRECAFCRHTWQQEIGRTTID